MFKKYFVGLDITSFENNGKAIPISRVTLNLDESNSVTSGDDSGIELVADCPFANQQMVENILQSVKGYRYQMYSAGSASIDPAAELGDGVTADGIYSVISSFNDDGSGYPSLSAPGKEEMEDEYPSAGGPMTQDINRKLKSVRSEITKTAEEIRLYVVDEIAGVESSLTQTADSLTSQIQSVDGRVSTVSQTVDSLTAQIKAVDGRVTTISQTLDGITLSAETSENKSTISLSSDGIQLSSTDIVFSGMVTFKELNGAPGSGATLINGAWLQTGTVTASIVQGSKVQLLADDQTVVGILGMTSASTAGMAINLTSLGALRFRANEGNIYISADGHNFPSYLELSNNEIILGTRNNPQYSYVNPNRSGVTSFGSIAVQYRDIFLNNPPTIISDRMAKSEISYDIDKYQKFFELLKPVSFRLAKIEGSGLHLGLIAQDVEEAMSNAGLSADDFSALVKGEGTYALRYEEFIPLLIRQVQNLTARIEELEAKS